MPEKLHDVQSSFFNQVQSRIVEDCCLFSLRKIFMETVWLLGTAESDDIESRTDCTIGLRHETMQEYGKRKQKKVTQYLDYLESDDMTTAVYGFGTSCTCPYSTRNFPALTQSFQITPSPHQFRTPCLSSNSCL